MKRERPEKTKHLTDLVGGPLDGQRYETDNPLDSVEHGGDPDAYVFKGEEVCGRRQLVHRSFVP